MALDVALDQLHVRLLRAGARPPAHSRPGDAGYDLRCAEGFSLWPGERLTVPTGVAIALRAGRPARPLRRQRPRPGGPELPRRAPRRAREPRPLAVRGGARRPDRPAPARPVHHPGRAHRGRAPALARRPRRERLRLLRPLEREDHTLASTRSAGAPATKSAGASWRRERATKGTASAEIAAPSR